MYTELLKLCGYEESEIERDRPRIDKAFGILGIESGDVAHAETRIKNGFEVELASVRKNLGIYLKRLVNLVLCRDEWEKVVYIAMGEPPLNSTLNQLDGVYSEQPGIALGFGLGFIFGKLNPILQSAEAHGMPAGAAMCSGASCDLGAIAKGAIPPPDVALVSNYYCDQECKPYDLIQQIYGTRVIHIDSCWDSPWGQYPEIDSRRVRYLGSRLRAAIGELEQALEVRISDEMLRKGSVQYAKLYYGSESCAELYRNADPQPISQTSLILHHCVSAMHYDRVQVSELPTVYSSQVVEIKERINAGQGVVPKGSPRVAMFASPLGDPAIQRMIEACGLQVPIFLYMEQLPFQRKQSPYTSWEERAAHALLNGGYFYDTSAIMYRVKEITKIHKVDGILWFYPYSCRMHGYLSVPGKKYFEEELGLPTLTLEMETFDARTYSIEAFRTRVEAFAEMLRARKARNT